VNQEKHACSLQSIVSAEVRPCADTTGLELISWIIRDAAGVGYIQPEWSELDASEGVKVARSVSIRGGRNRVIDFQHSRRTFSLRG
jgi:hypothetical protein